MHRTIVAALVALLIGSANAALVQRDWSRDAAPLDEPGSVGALFDDGIRAKGLSTPELNAALRAIRAGRYAEVPTLVGNAVDRPQTAAPAHELLGIALALQGQIGQARVHFLSALRANPKQVTALIKLGDLAAAEGKSDDADSWYERARAIDDADPQLAQRLGMAAERKGRVREAIAWYEKGLRGTADDYLGIRLNLAGLYNRTGQPARTLALLGAHPKLAESAAASFHLGVARTQLGRTREAVADLQRARAIDPRMWRAALALGVAQRLSGSPKESVATLEQARQLAPRSPLPPVELGHSLLASQRPQEAIEAFGEAVERSGERPAYRLELAQACLAIGDHAKALELFTALAKLDGAPLEVGLGLAAAYQQAGDLVHAQREFDRLRSAAPKNPEVLYRAGLFEAFRRNYDQAIQLLGSASAAPALRTPSLRAIAFAYGQKGDHARAIETARRLVAESGDDPGAVLVLALVLDGAAKQAEAARAYEKVLERDAGHVLALNNLAVLRGDSGDRAGALALAERARQLAPADPQVLDTHGWALHRAGRNRDAAAALTEAARRAPDSASIRYHLGVVRLALGQKETGRSDLAASLDLSPQAAWAPEARRLLEP